MTEALSPTPIPPEKLSTPNPDTDTGMQSLSDALRTCFRLLQIMMIIIGIIFLARGFFIVEHGTQVLVSRFGAFLEEDGSPRIFYPGIHYSMPILDRRVVVDIREQQISFQKEFTPNETLVSQIANSGGGQLRPGEDGYCITGDTNIIHSEWQVTYEVNDPYLFLTTFVDRDLGERHPQTNQVILRRGPEQFLREIIVNSIVRVSAGMSIDNLLAEKTAHFTNEVRRLSESRLERYACGIQIKNLSYAKKFPPKSTNQAFLEVQNALIGKGSNISEAKSKALEIIEQAKGISRKHLDEAEVYVNAMVNSAQSDAAVISSLLHKYPDQQSGLQLYLKQYHQEALSDILSSTRTFVVRPGQTWYMTGPAMEEMIGEGAK